MSLLGQRSLMQPAVGRLPCAFKPINMRIPTVVKPTQSRQLTILNAAAVDDLELEEMMASKPTVQVVRKKLRSKRYRDMATKSPGRQAELEPLEAVKRMKSTASTRFTESIEMHARMGLDPKFSDQQLRATVSLPHGTGKELRVAVLTQGDNVKLAQLAGADVFGGDDLIERISGGFLEFDKLIATPDMMPKVAKLGRVLGPRGLMPNPKAGTVTTDISGTVKDFKGGKVEYRLDKTGNLHVLFGRADFKEDAMVDNLKAIQDSIDANKPPGAKGVYWKSMFVCTTMGPSVRVNISALQNIKSKGE
ncbi:hypothetical protein CEUSTIGMA_g5706.t1 [Chlamydomonas eustigma]|uniref:Ribosomal protein n=1 Tax=Chlamydomonas eustigma TaxID=1157962 RepID=A0A250X5A2_9CHLO|nr:hypothetical protein CEUSTIGMA_g5706.t1 [Chlamydomonas eustigma]|eukprot:GAX78264.1 hypothetical protein CEUSTIGMA_g5706.t1 [Chlamydomonas eustigma]